MKIKANDRIDEIVTNASRELADEAFIQNNDQATADEHDDSWYELQEKLRDAMLKAAFKIINEEDVPEPDVEELAATYNGLTASQKDKFLRLTENQ